MNRLRAWCLAPSAAVLVVLFLAPLTILLAYTVLTRGAYGGTSLPWLRRRRCWWCCFWRR